MVESGPYYYTRATHAIRQVCALCRSCRTTPWKSAEPFLSRATDTAIIGVYPFMEIYAQDRVTGSNRRLWPDYSQVLYLSCVRRAAALSFC